MRTARRIAWSAILATFLLRGAHAQDLAPRAYTVTPIHFNAVTLTYSFSDGGLLFNGSLPVTNATGRIHTSVFTFFHAINIFGHSSNVTASLPYAVGNFQGTLMSTETTVYRSGLLGSSFRFSVNLKGGPAMKAGDFSKWRQKTVVGASFRVIPPTGQYDPTKLINVGANRWAFKPELGYSHRWRNWLLDTYGGVWFFTKNSDYFSRNQFSSGTNTQSQNPVGSFEGHLSYDLKPRLWASLDGNFWFGGKTSLNGVDNPNTFQKNSRIGGTISLPVPKSKHESLKFSYSNGAYVRFGGNFQSVSVAWQYSWLGRPN